MDVYLDKVHACKMLNDFHIQNNEHNNLFPITQQLDNLPHFASYDVDNIASGDNDDADDNYRKSKDIFCQKLRLSSTPALNI